MRGDCLERMRCSGGNKYPGRPSLCRRIPGKEECLRFLKGPNPGICRNCQAPEVQMEKMKVFAP